MINQRWFEKFIPNNNSEIEDKFFQGDPFCSNDDDTSIINESEFYKTVILDEIFHHASRPKPDSENLHYIPKPSKFQSFSKFPEIFDLPDKDADADADRHTVFGSSTSFANQSKSTLHFNHSHTSNRTAPIKNDLPQSKKLIASSFYHNPLQIKNHFCEISIEWCYFLKLNRVAREQLETHIEVFLCAS